MKTAFGIFLFALCMAAFPAVSCAENTSNFTIVFEEYPPYEYMENGEAHGYNVDIIREAFSRMGIFPRFEAMSWKRGLFELKNGSILALSCGFKNPEREQFAMFPRNYLHLETNAVFVRKDNDSIKSLEDLKYRTVGAVEGYTYGPDFDHLPGVRFDKVSSNPLLVRMLAENRVDAIAGNVRVIHYLSHHFDVQDKIRPVFEISRAPLYLMFSRMLGKKSSYLVQRFDQAMDAMKADGTLERMRSGH